MSRDDIIRMARMVFDVETDSRGRETFSGDNYGVERFAALVAAAEREACAKVAFDADHMGSVNLKMMKNRIGNAIRARGQQ